LLKEKLLARGIVREGALEDILLVGRSLRLFSGRHLVEPSVDGPFERPQTLAQLESMRGRISHEDLSQLGLMAQVIAEIPKLLPPKTGIDEALDALCKFQNNNFAIVDELSISVGAGVFPHGASLNHSCKPNCLLTYDFQVGRAPIQVVRAMKEVQEGVELTHAYVNLALPSWQRRSVLRKNYGFDCACEQCDSSSCEEVDALLVADVSTCGAVVRPGENCPLPLAPPSVERDTALTRADELIQKAAPEEDAIVELRMLEEACCHREQWLHKRHMDVTLAHTLAHTTAMVAGDWTAAEMHCERLVDNYKWVYPEWHPVTAVQMFALAELKVMVGKTSEVQNLYEHAYKTLCLAFGEKHKMVEDLKACMRE